MSACDTTKYNHVAHVSAVLIIPAYVCSLPSPVRKYTSSKTATMLKIDMPMEYARLGQLMQAFVAPSKYVPESQAQVAPS